jgi:hypothetical protein
MLLLFKANPMLRPLIRAIQGVYSYSLNVLDFTHLLCIPPPTTGNGCRPLMSSLMTSPMMTARRTVVLKGNLWRCCYVQTH